VYAAAEQNLLAEGNVVLSTIDAQIGQLYGLWGVWGGNEIVVNAPPFICVPEKIPEPDGGESPVILGSGVEYRQQFSSPRLLNAAMYGDITPDAAVMATRLASGTTALDLQPAHRLTPQYVQRDIGWKKLSEQGGHD
jgi:tRNA threonylcarbamoyladenosine biosynthesis protein TsaB